jgi:GntR family transcriptional regulator
MAGIARNGEGHGPLYQQVSGRLRTLIASGDFPVGGRFLTEREVSQRFAISRPTANKILSTLVSEGLLEFRRGVGTFVCGLALDYSLKSLVSFTEKALAAGKRPQTKVLAFGSLRASDARDRGDLAALLRVNPDAPLYYMERLRLADRVPVILEKRYVVGEYCPRLKAKDVRGSLYKVWLERYGLPVEGAEERIRAVNATGADAQALMLAEGGAAMLIQSIGFLEGHRPLWSEQTLYRGDSYEFHNQLGGIEPGTAAAGTFLDTHAEELLRGAVRRRNNGGSK